MMQSMKTYSATPSDVDRRWFVVDADGVVLGRLAAVVANILRGKNKPMFTPNIDCGDYIVIINAEKILLTGNKRTDKTYYWHTGYPGGIKSRTADRILDGAHPERVISKAVERMLPKTVLGRQQIGKLKIYSGSEHPHEAQNPEVLDVAGMNPKNKRSA